jgi:hypothetical protein
MTGWVYTLDDAPIAREFVALNERLPNAFPGDWTFADVQRGMAIHAAERQRQEMRMAVLDEVSEAYRAFPDAGTAGDACQLAGIDPDDIDRRLEAIPPPDEVGLRWFIDEHERAEAAGTLIRIPV